MPTTKPAILGGDPVRKHPFPVRKTLGEAEKKAAIAAIDSDVLSAFIGARGNFFGGGPKIREFEKAWSEYFGFRHSITVNSWTSGLVACVGSLGLNPGDEMICPPMTMTASAVCALNYGVVPIFADVDPNTVCLDPVSVEQRITPRTRAIMVVHLFGIPADMDQLCTLARKHNLRIIEDAAQAPGARFKQKHVGAIGDIGGFSLNYHKHIHTGEGGVITTNDDRLAHHCQLIRNHGENAIDDLPLEQLYNVFGGNFRLTEWQAAIGVEQLSRLPGLLQTRQSLAQHFANRLKGLRGISTPRLTAEYESAWYIYPLHFHPETAGLSRRQFVQAVTAELPKAQHVECHPLAEGYTKPIYLNRLFQTRSGMGRDHFPFSLSPNCETNYQPGSCPVAEHLYRESLLITPLIREPLQTDDIDDLADAIEKTLLHAESISKALGPETSAPVQTLVDAANQTVLTH